MTGSPASTAAWLIAQEEVFACLIYVDPSYSSNSVTQTSDDLPGNKRRSTA